jgi:hypothetical protein
MKLLIEELKSASVGQKITPNQNYNIEAIRPHLYKHNTATGSILVTVHDTNGNVIASSTPILISALSASTFFHGHVTFNIKASLQAGVEYLVRVTGIGGYTFSESAYVGFCRDFDFHTYPATYPVSGALASPFDIQIWARSAR